MSSFFQKYSVDKPNCPKCGLDRDCKSPRMKCTGDGEKEILIIAEAPGAEEDKQNIQLVGKSGKRLRRELRLLGINLGKDCWKTNAVNCRPVNEKGENTPPTSAQIQCCTPYVRSVIKKVKAKKIFLFGKVALESFYAGRTKYMTSIGKVNGMRVWDDEYKAWIFPMWHPSFVERKSKDALIQAEFKRCLTRAVEADHTPLQKTWNPIHKLLDFKQAIHALENCLRNDTTIAIDYEGTGLDMHKEGHKTTSFGWANDKGGWAVPVDHPYWKKKQQRKVHDLICKILRKRKIRKIVHNITFEYQWTKAVMKCEPRNFFYCTQLATHVLDNRRGITKLKFQAFIRWGIGEYDAFAGRFIKTNPKTGFNDMLKMPIDAMLEYNAYDALYTYELYREQLTEYVADELKAYKFLHDGAIVLCEMSVNGICIKESYYLQQRAELEAERNTLIDGINSSKEARLYAKRFGAFDYNSPKHLQKMLFKVLKIKPIKETKTGYSVDEEVLTKIGIPLTKNIIAVRKLNKMIGTYVDGFLKQTHSGVMHPYFSLHNARSFRSSSSRPNFQNVPKRDPKANRIIRSGMVPRPGRVLGEMDFSGAEISTSCYYHKDPTFIKYQTEGGGDMHNDACAIILGIEGEKVPKPLRQATKGIWTFSQFYGSYYVSCAKQGYEEYPLCTEKDGSPCQIHGMDIADWMKKTFKNYNAFEAHLKKFEKKFWYEWFIVYTQWKDKIVASYVKNGYVETFLGFRFKGYMDKKQCTNYPIQGTSFHLLLYTASQFLRELKRRGFETLIIGQIHDSLILDIPVDEIDEVGQVLNEIVSNLHNVFKWMDFPMGLDFEISKSYEQGGSFASMEKVAL